MLADTNFDVVRGEAEDNIKVRGGQQLWCFEGVGIENADILKFSTGRHFFISMSTYWTTSTLVPGNISVRPEQALLSGTVVLAVYTLAEKVKTN